MLAQEILIQQLSDAQRAQPIPQFLRHVRNGVGHNGRWEFRGNEPRYAATWRTFTLDATMHGQRVFKDINGDGLLGPGDPIRLLWDIEQAYPNLKVSELTTPPTVPVTAAIPWGRPHLMV